MMENTLIHIYDDNNKLLKRYRPKSEEDLFYRYDKLASVRLLELRPQLNHLLASGEKELQEKHSLFCTYVKFGACQQQQADFMVLIQLKQHRGPR